MLMLASLLFQANAISMMVSLIVFVVCIVIVILLGKWLLSVLGVSIPQPLMVVLGLLVFLIFLLFFLNYTGLWVWGARYH